MRRSGLPLLVLALLVALLVPARGRAAASYTEPTPIQRACTDSAGTGIEAPAVPPTGLRGLHAAFYGQSGDPLLCAGSTAVVTAAFLNTGTLGWYGGKLGSEAFLGIPGDGTSLLGGDGTQGTPNTGWVAANRLSGQLTDFVGPGQVGWFSFTVKAPLSSGIYRLPVRPVIDGTQWLEDTGVHWDITVKSADGDPLPTMILPAITTPVAQVQPAPRTYYPATLADGTRTIRVPSLMFHYVDWLPNEKTDALRMDLSVSPKDFEDMLTWLYGQGYTTVTTRQLWWTLDQGAPLPAKPIELTFDDGYSSHYTYALPLLRKYGFVGTFFVTANLVGKPGYLTRDQVRALADAGMDVESHAVDHFAMASLPLASQQYQMCVARRILSDWTGTDVRHFAYPAGDFNATSFDALASCGYLSAYKKTGGSVQSSGAMFTLQRSRVRGQQGLGALFLALRD